MDESEFEPADDVSLKTVLDAVNRQSKNSETIVEAKANEGLEVGKTGNEGSSW
jgi:hypothetical protein